MDRGKVLDDEDLERIGEFGRYRDVDGDGIPYRTIPGTTHPLGAWFARGTGHNEQAVYSESPEDWTKNMERLFRKLETAREDLPKAVIESQPGAEIGLIGFGSTDVAIQEARERLEADEIPTDYLRLRSIPIGAEVVEFIESHDRIYVIEMNTTGQLRHLLQLEMPEVAAKIQSVRHNDGVPLTARLVVEKLMEMERG